MGKCQVGLQTPTKIPWNHVTLKSFSLPLGNHDLDLGVWVHLGKTQKKSRTRFTGGVLCSKHIARRSTASLKNSPS